MSVGCHTKTDVIDLGSIVILYVQVTWLACQPRLVILLLATHCLPLTLQRNYIMSLSTLLILILSEYS